MLMEVGCQCVPPTPVVQIPQRDKGQGLSLSGYYIQLSLCERTQVEGDGRQNLNLQETWIQR